MRMNFGRKVAGGVPSGLVMVGLLAAMLVLGGCADWSEFGEGPTNPHRTKTSGPTSGLTGNVWLHPFGSTATTHGAEVGILTDSGGAYYVTSYAAEVHVYDSSGVFQDHAVLPSGIGPRALPYLVNDLLNKKTYLFTGSEGGNFHVVEIDKSVSPYAVTVTASSTGVGVSESSPKRSQSGDFYLAEQWGDVHRFQYNFSTATLTHAATYSLGERVAGAIAIFDAEPAHAGEEVLVATQDGGFHVLDASLSSVIWSETTGYGSAGVPHDEYYGGVTVAKRGVADPIALLPLSGQIDTPVSPNTGMLRAINLTTRSIEWELIPSHTTLGVDDIPGSVSLMHPFWSFRPHHFQVFSGGEEGDLEGRSVVIRIDPNGTPGCENCPPSIELTNASEPIWPEDAPPPHLVNIITLFDFHATFASSDGHLYGVDLVSGTEVWSYPLSAEGVDTPVTDRSNFVYVGDGASVLHAVLGASGAGVWTDTMITPSATSTQTIVKLGIAYNKELIAGSGVSAYSLR